LSLRVAGLDLRLAAALVVPVVRDIVLLLVLPRLEQESERAGDLRDPMHLGPLGRDPEDGVVQFLNLQILDPTHLLLDDALVVRRKLCPTAVLILVAVPALLRGPAFDELAPEDGGGLALWTLPLGFPIAIFLLQRIC